MGSKSQETYVGTANIAFGKVGIGGAVGTLPPIITVEAAENVTTNASTSASAAGAASAIGNKFQNAVRVLLSEDGWVEVGLTPTATKTTSTKLVANVPEFFALRAGDTVAVIDDV